MNKRPALLSAVGFAFVLLAILGISLTAQAAPSPVVTVPPLAPNDNTYQILPFSQTWTITTLITTNDDWSGVPGIIGYLGDYTSSSPVNVDPQTLLTDTVGVNIDVIANQTNPNTNTSGGVAEFDNITDPVVALQGSGTADAPHIVIYLDTTNLQDITVVYNVRDIDGSADNAVQQVALHYRVGSSGNFTNLPAGYIADATTGGAATLVTPVTVTLPASANNQSQVQLRIMTTNATGSDEWVGIDDILVTGTPLALEADLDLTKSGPATASAGDPITYTINLSNTGNVTATSTIVTDTLPVEVSFVTYTTTLPGSFSQPDAQTLVWDLGAVAPGASGHITVQGTVSTGLSSGTLFTNTVSASTTSTETITANNTATAATLIGAPDLIVVKDGPVSVNAGDPVAYTLTYSNAGNLPATGVVLVDQLPAAMSYVTDSLGTGVQVGNTITWTLGNLAVSASGSVVLTATTSTAGDQVNLATISSASPDGNPLNNVAVFTTTVLGGDPFVTKTGPAIVFGGELITYTIVYGNRGNVAADVTLTDTLPISFTTSDIAFDNSGLNPIDGTNTRAWTATLAAGDRFTFTLALTVPTAIASNTRITNTVQIATGGLGNNPIDDVSAASSTVYQIVPISVVRAGSNTQVFGIEGQVIYVPNTFGTNEWGVQDASGGIAVFYSPVPVVALGDRVRLVATRGAFGGAPQLGSPVYYSANRGSGPQVTPRPYTTGQVASGSTEGWLVVITGTVSNLTACTPGTTNYEFNLDDGSGSAVIFVDKDTLVDVCALGVVNGDPLVVTGFSTQFNGLMEIKPRFQADVKRVYQITFVYRDLEDVVQPGEDVQLHGDFTNWAVNPITLSHDAGYTVFSTTLILPTDVAQNYKYFVSAGGGSGYDWLNTNNRSIAPQDGVTVQTDYRNVVVGWAKLQWPPAITLTLGEATPNIYGRLYIQGVTNGVGAGRGLRPEVGYGTTANPVSWLWSTMEFNAKDGPNNDEYRGVFTPTASGVYSYATRYNGNWGVGNPNSLWTYASLNSIPFDPTQAGVLTVTAPQLSITKTVATAHPIVDLGEVVTYTFTLSNTGDGAAANVLITDVVPAAVTFGGFVQQNGAVYGSGVITWNGGINAGASATVIFTATVKTDRALHGTGVTNTVQYTSGGDSGSANATFAIVNRYFTYLPFIRR